MSSPNDEDTIEAIVDAVRRYVDANPAAADTADGIRRWWLPPVLADERLAIVRRALERLVDERVLEPRTLRDQRVVYARRHAPQRRS